MELRLLSVNVGMPRIIGSVHDEPVLSAFVKFPVAEATTFVGSSNIDGDRQADLSVHGGADKAVYCYPADHWPWWEREKALPCRPATFGENLTVEGADETEVAIGDRYRWGDVLLEISQPRAPCFKFAICAKRDDAPALMTASGRCGWYFRVLREGHVPVRGASLVLEERSGGPSVREAFFAARDPHLPEHARRRIAEFPALSVDWRNSVVRRLVRDNL